MKPDETARMMVLPVQKGRSMRLQVRAVVVSAMLTMLTGPIKITWTRWKRRLVMQTDYEISRALESHERALFNRWEDSQEDDCEKCGEEPRDCECGAPLWDPCDMERDEDPTDYYDRPA